MPEKKHTQKVLLIPMFLLAIYLGYCIGSLYGTDHTFKTAADQLRSIALHPFPLQLTPMTGKSILVCVAARADRHLVLRVCQTQLYAR